MKPGIILLCTFILSGCVTHTGYTSSAPVYVAPRSHYHPPRVYVAPPPPVVYTPRYHPYGYHRRY